MCKSEMSRWLYALGECHGGFISPFFFIKKEIVYSSMLFIIFLTGKYGFLKCVREVGASWIKMPTRTHHGIDELLVMRRQYNRDMNRDEMEFLKDFFSEVANNWYIKIQR